MKRLQDFREIWAIDFEFTAAAGELPTVLCMVAREIRSGRLIRMWRDELARLTRAPFSVGADVLIVAYYASAEIGCFLALGWKLPEHVLDPYCEFSARSNGLPRPGGRGLLAAMMFYELGATDAEEKRRGRELAMRGEPFTEAERKQLLDYCTHDVDNTVRLVLRMFEAGDIEIPTALLRGRFMRATGVMEAVGVPIDVETHSRLSTHWHYIQERLIAAVDEEFHVFEGRTFKAARWLQYTESKGISWPRTESDLPRLDDDTFREYARRYDDVARMRELRTSLAQMRLSDLSVGTDARNRVLLSPFAASTSRNAPSNSRFIFGPSAWYRSLIKPEPGKALAYVDWSQQEFGIAAALSGDPRMTEAYCSGDPYLRFAIQAGAAPKGATKQTHAKIREAYKACTLAVQYGMGVDSLAVRIDQSPAHARALLEAHRRTYSVFWDWNDAVVDYAMINGRLHTVFNWPLHLTRKVNVRSLRNFPMQANGAEMMRLACCFATELGVRVCCPIHDAMLIEAGADEIDDAVRLMQKAMAKASVAVLRTLELRSDAKIIKFPERYVDERGVAMWNTVNTLLRESERAAWKGEVCCEGRPAYFCI